jgi:hypothetical protein
MQIGWVQKLCQLLLRLENLLVRMYSDQRPCRPTQTYNNVITGFSSCPQNHQEIVLRLPSCGMQFVMMAKGKVTCMAAVGCAARARSRRLLRLFNQQIVNSKLDMHICVIAPAELLCANGYRHKYAVAIVVRT